MTYEKYIKNAAFLDEWKEIDYWKLYEAHLWEDTFLARPTLYDPLIDELFDDIKRALGI